jgi:hypothetical protein
VFCRDQGMQLAGAYGCSGHGFSMRWVGLARFLPDARVLPAPERAVVTLQGMRCWVQAPELQQALSAQGALLADGPSEELDLAVLDRSHLPAELELLDRWGIPIVPSWSLAWIVKEA